MGRVLVNNTTIAYTFEDTENVPDNIGFIAGEDPGTGTIAGTAVWHEVETNGGPSRFGAEITTVARDPISKSRQRRKGVVTDLDSGVTFQTDLTGTEFEHFVEAWIFSKTVNPDLEVSGVVGATDVYTFATVSATRAAAIQFETGEYASLLFGRGFTDTSNNGLKPVSADGTTTTATFVGTTSADETVTQTETARLETAGIRFLAASTHITAASSGVNMTLTAAGGITGFDWTTLGLTLGQFIHVGQPNGSGGATNALQNTGANDTFGYARVVGISATVLTLDKADASLTAAATFTEPVTLDLIWGKFIRNVDVDAVTEDVSEYLTRTIQFQQLTPNLDASLNYTYAKGNTPDVMSINFPLTDKATVDWGFVGTDTTNPQARKALGNSDTPIISKMDDAFGTSSDCARLRVTDVDETGLSSFFRNITLTINNQASPEKLLCNLGARFINVGNLLVDLEATVLFDNALVPARIRSNTTVTMEFAVKNDDGVIFIDLPSMTLGGGAKEYPVNESVRMTFQGQAFRDGVLGTSIGISTLPLAA